MVCLESEVQAFSGEASPDRTSASDLVSNPDMVQANIFHMDTLLTSIHSVGVIQELYETRKRRNPSDIRPNDPHRFFDPQNKPGGKVDGKVLYVSMSCHPLYRALLDWRFPFRLM